MKKLLKTVMVGVIALMIIGAPSTSYADNYTPFPDLESPVRDQSGTLSVEDVMTLVETVDNEGTASRDRVRIAVLMVEDNPTGQTEDDVISNAVNNWNNKDPGFEVGVLLYMNTSNKRMRIYTSQEASLFLTDSKKDSIIKDVIAPYFNREDYANGLYQGVYEIRTELSKAGKVSSLSTDEESDTDWTAIWTVIGVIAIGVLFAGIVIMVLVWIGKLMFSKGKDSVAGLNRHFNASSSTLQKELDDIKSKYNDMAMKAKLATEQYETFKKESTDLLNEGIDYAAMMTSNPDEVKKEVREALMSRSKERPRTTESLPTASGESLPWGSSGSIITPERSKIEADRRALDNAREEARRKGNMDILYGNREAR